MQITDEMALRAARREASFDGYDCFEAMSRMSRDRYIARSRAALEAALGARSGLSWNGFNIFGERKSIDEAARWLHNSEEVLPVVRRELISERDRNSACIEDLAAALRPFAERNEWDDDLGTAEQPEKANARAALERWGLR